jgi:hypothetical protein
MDSKLRKTVLLMLSSQHAGEILAARDAVLKIAKTLRLDIHSLTTAFGLALQIPPRGSRSGEISHQEMAMRIADWDEMGGALPERERKFVHEMTGWGRPSEKQLTWLKAIYARAQRSQGWSHGRT